MEGENATPAAASTTSGGGSPTATSTAGTSPAGGDADGTPSTGTSPNSAAAGANAPTTATGTAATTGTPEPKADTAAFDVDAWDLDIDHAPENTRDLLRKLWDKKSKNVEAGATKKYTELAKERDALAQERTAWEVHKAQLETDLHVYKTMSIGEEDPRVKTLGAEIVTVKGELAAIQRERDALKADYQGYLDHAESQRLVEYKKKYKAIFADDGKMRDLYALLLDEDVNWDDEAAAELVGQPEEVRKLAKDIAMQTNLQGSSMKLAVELARQRLNGTSAHDPNSAASVTHGAQPRGAVHPASAPGGSLRDMTMPDARREAARRALGRANNGR